MGNLQNVKPFYENFRSCVFEDLCMSDRLRESGLDQLLYDIVQFCFAGEIGHAPVETRILLENLFHPDHSICTTIVKGKTIVSISQWPSWLNKGHKRHVETFNKVFYANSYVKMPCEECKLCNKNFGKSFWHHMLYECS